MVEIAGVLKAVVIQSRMAKLDTSVFEVANVFERILTEKLGSVTLNHIFHNLDVGDENVFADYFKTDITQEKCAEDVGKVLRKVFPRERYGLTSIDKFNKDEGVFSFKFQGKHSKLTINGGKASEQGGR